MGEYLQLSPPELKFRFELRKNIPVTLSLHNPGDEPVAFKVKTTAPKKYCVRPSSGVVDPKATKDIQVRKRELTSIPTVLLTVVITIPAETLSLARQPSATRFQQNAISTLPARR